MAPPRECLYATLGVAQTATESDIRKAYRALALSHHPDKNPGRESAASEQFKAVQHAYSVLSDAHERAWYDAHRTQILRGHDPADVRDPDSPPDPTDATEVDLFACFSSSAYRGFADGADGFYGVYADVFDRLWREEVDELVRDAKRVPAAAPFGGADAAWDNVRAFYDRWDAFVSVKSFAFADKWHLGEAPNREVRRLMEKENKKARAAVRKEFNSTVRELVAFVKKRDPRVARRRKEEQEGRERKLEQAKERERARAQMRKDNAEQMRAARDEALEEDAFGLDQILEAIAMDERMEAERMKKKKKGRRKQDDVRGSEDETGRSDDVSEGDSGDAGTEEGGENGEGIDGKTEDSGSESDEGIGDEEKEEEEEKELYCVACRKAFRSVAQRNDHERSKKHKLAVARLKRKVLKEEKAFAKAQGGEALGLAGHEDRMDKAEDETQVEDEGEDEGGQEDAEEAELLRAKAKKSKKKRKKQARQALVEGGEDGDEAGVEDDSEGVAAAGAEGKAGSGGEVGQEAEGVAERKQGGLSKKQQRRLREQRKKEREDGDGAADAGSAWLKCNVCAATFGSRNKLMRHVEQNGHAVHVEGAAGGGRDGRK